MREELRAELIAMEADDPTTRARLAADGSLFRGYHPEMEAVHRRNAARPREYDCDESLRHMEPIHGIEDPDRLEERRRRMGLPPMRWRLPPMMWRLPPPPDEPPPADRALRLREMREWARRVGWIADR